MDRDRRTPDQVRWETAAYEQGRANRGSISENPFKHGTGSWHAWRAGWNKGATS